MFGGSDAQWLEYIDFQARAESNLQKWSELLKLSLGVNEIERTGIDAQYIYYLVLQLAGVGEDPVCKRGSQGGANIAG